jgi:Ca2+-binding EF-hand superfamily protein
MPCRFLFLAAWVVLLLVPEPGMSQGPPGQGGGRRWGGGGGGGSWGDPNQFFNQLANGKDVWVRAEVTDQRQLMMFDRSAERLGITNGQITRDQFVTSMQQRMSRQRPGGGPDGSNPANPAGSPGTGTPANGQGNWSPDRWAEGMFRRLDQNGDGLLNYDEMPDELKAERDKWDTNKDGFIDLNEFKAYFQAVVQQRLAENGGQWPWQGGWTDSAAGAPAAIATPEEARRPVVYRAGNLPKELPSWFKQLDTDNDGQIGLYEWKKAGRSIDEFLKIDRNNDGFLTVDEVLRYEAEQKKTPARSAT